MLTNDVVSFEQLGPDFLMMPNMDLIQGSKVLPFLSNFEGYEI